MATLGGSGPTSPVEKIVRLPASGVWPTWIAYPSWQYGSGNFTVTASSTTTIPTNNIVWNNWVTTATNTVNVVWNNWQTQPNYQSFQFRPPRVVETPEQLQARLDREQAAREEANRRWLAEQKRMAGAQDRAMELLLMVLTDEERRYYDEHDKILVRAPSGRMYVIGKHGVHGNISETDEHGCMLGRVCVAPGMYDRDSKLALPLADGWLGQYLAIKHNEEALRTTGNWSMRAACKQPDVPVLRAA